MGYLRRFALVAALAVVAGACAPVAEGHLQGRAEATGGIHTIRHVIVIMRENRSFDSYFGTSRRRRDPDGNEQPTVCVPDPQVGGCVSPFHADGRPDPRPDVREVAPILGHLQAEFDFSQAPLAPLVLPRHPVPGPSSIGQRGQPGS